MRNILEDLAIAALLGAKPALKKRASVLMYHSVGSDGSMLTISSADLRKQLEYLNENNGKRFRVVSLSHLYEQASSGKSVAGMVALTFDDAYENFYTLAWPLLKKYDLPATVFVPTGLLGTVWTLFDGTRIKVMSKEMLTEISNDPLVECMPHTHTHPDLMLAKESSYGAELDQSRRILEDISGRSRSILAYPKGSYNEAVIEYLRKNGWVGAVGIDFGLISNKTFPKLQFKLPRNRVSPEMPFKLFRLLVSDGLGIYLRFLAIMPRRGQ